MNVNKIRADIKKKAEEVARLIVRDKFQDAKTLWLEITKEMMTYEVVMLRDAIRIIEQDLISIKNEEEKVIDFCSSCESEQNSGIGPSHNGSKNCASGSIASGGRKAHCTCDTCF